MEDAVTQLSWPQSQARQAADDRDAEAKAKAKQQRRKVQNRKNQRAHRTYAPRSYNPFYTENPLQDYGSRAETRGMFRIRVHSRSGAGASTSPTIFRPKRFR
jgi:hypothetical protein